MLDQLFRVRHSFSQLVVKEVQKESRKNIIKEAVISKMLDNEPIMNRQMIITQVDEQENIQLKPWEVSQMMRNDMNMRFKKIKDISWQQNSDQNMLCR